MNRFSLLASALLAAAPLALVLPGCGGGNSGPGSTATPTTSPTATNTPSASPTASATTTGTSLTPRPVREFYVNVAAASVTEGDWGQKMMNFVVTGVDTYGEQHPLSFSYQTLDGTAIAGPDNRTAGHDYDSTSGKSSVVTGSTTTISVPINGDMLIEDDETFTLRVFDAQGLYKVTERTGTIVNDDVPRPTITPSGM